MARIIVGSYMVRYPLGGMMSWVLQYLVGFQRLGHEVYFVEKSGHSGACFDPSRNVMTDDPSYGTATVAALLERFGLDDHWCFVDVAGKYHGLERMAIEAVFRSADVFLDMGTHGAWLEEARYTQCRVLGDGEPGFTQMKMAKQLELGEVLPQYDFYYTAGVNVGTAKSTAPTAGRSWRTLFHPVVVDLFPHFPGEADAPFTTVMNWQSHAPIEFGGRTYGQKDVEFAKFVDLPRRTRAAMEVAVAGKDVPRDQLRDSGWRVRDAHQTTKSFDAFQQYIFDSKGEFGVCKNVFVVTSSGWFSDRSAAYLASGRPVVLEDTGFSDHLPCGRGLFAVSTLDEAAAAIDEINNDYDRHSSAARQIARECLEAKSLLGRFLSEIGL
jgi:hypothetical protein